MPPSVCGQGRESVHVAGGFEDALVTSQQIARRVGWPALGPVAVSPDVYQLPARHQMT